MISCCAWPIRRDTYRPLNQAEKHRQILCDNLSFEPYNAFKRIVGPVRSTMTVDDVQQFLADNRVFKSTINIEKFIKHYSGNIRSYSESSCDRIDYREFLRIVLPMNSSHIREQASQRPIHNSSYAKLLPSVEGCLADVISYEIDFFDNLYLYFVG